MSEDILNLFLSSVAGNPKISASHISLFSAILCCRKTGENCFNVSRRKVMALSKIRSTATYHKCMDDLVALGILTYLPSFNPKSGSIIKIDQ